MGVGVVVLEVGSAEGLVGFGVVFQGCLVGVGVALGGVG